MEGAQLQNIKGIGDKLSQKILYELGGEEELNQVIENLDLERLINIEGISQRKAIEIMNQLIGNPAQKFLKSERATQLYEEIIEKIGYNPEADLDNPTGSVFCSHGAGFNVPWDEVYDYMHLESYLGKLEKRQAAEEVDISLQNIEYRRGDEYNKHKKESMELHEIFTKTYGEIKRYKESEPEKQRHSLPCFRQRRLEDLKRRQRLDKSLKRIASRTHDVTDQDRQITVHWLNARQRCRRQTLLEIRTLSFR